MNALLESLAGPPLSAAEVKRWFELHTPVDIIDAQLMRAVQSMRRPDIDVICEVLAVVDQYHRRGAIDREQFKRLKGRIERHAVAGAQRTAEAPAPAASKPPRPPPAPAAPVIEAPVSAPKAAPSSPVAAVIGSGTMLRDRYEVRELLGEGGMSCVYRASDRQRAGLPGHDANVAIKVLRPSLNGRPEAIKALRLEYERAQRLSHPSIINVFSIDADGDTHFITMELLRGESLSAVIKNLHPGALQREQAFEIIRKLGDAVAYAHDQDVVHADIKPGNVMITENGELRLFDFGAAWLAQREPWIYEAMHRSLQGATPTYASPERLSGGAPTIRDDLFSFSCLAYELLSGAHPFDRRPTNIARDSDSRPTRIPGLGQRQWQALQRGLEWQRLDRQADMRELLDDLLPKADRRGRGLDLRQLRAAIAPRQSRVAGLTMVFVGAVAFAMAHFIRAETPLRIIPDAVQPWLGGILRWLAQVLPGVN